MLMAMAVLSGWIRAFHIHDGVIIQCDAKAVMFLDSCLDGLVLMRQVEATAPTFPRVTGGIEFHSGYHKGISVFTGQDIQWSGNWIGFRVGTLNGVSVTGLWKQTFIVVPYWLVVTLPTTLTAYLLLSSLRKKPETSPDISN